MNSGFKNTQIGIVPINWNTKTLEEINKPNFTISYGVVQPGPEDDNGVLFIRGGDIKNGKIGNKLRTISRSVSDSYSRTLLQGGEIVISLVGYPGECAVVPKSLSGVNIARQVGVIRINEENDKYFIQQYLSSTIGKKNLLGNLVGSAQQVINLNMLRKVYIPIPSLPEQQKIADILGTVDAKIEVIDQQITETEELKKGLMQRLLTKGIGHTEFKDSPLGEIPKSWEVVELSELSYINNKSLSRDTHDDLEFYYIDLSAVKSGTIEIPKEKVNYLNSPSRARRILKKGDVIMATVRPNLLGYGFANFDTENYICSTGFAIITPKSDVDGQFIYQNLYSQNVQSQIEKQIVGSNYPAINSSDVQNIKIPKPSYKEQIKISKILCSADEKTEVLSEKKTHYQELKQGLMQQLLTGKIRVNNLIEV